MTSDKDHRSEEQGNGKLEPFELLGSVHPRLPLFLTAPHSGEVIPPEAPWLNEISPNTLLTDVDRFVDQLYLPAVEALNLPLLTTRIHRYAADLNRFPEDVDQDSVVGSNEASGKFPIGFHWVKTTRDDRLMPKPISKENHRAIVALYHDAFHEEIAKLIAEVRARSNSRMLYHLDCHSMPSQGTHAHRDSGQKRPDVVISDQEGKSALPNFRGAVVEAFEREGFKTAVNWPYVGGRITQRYGKPAQGHQTIQIELNRALYMSEASREKAPEFESVSGRLERVLARIQYFLLNIPNSTN